MDDRRQKGIGLSELPRVRFFWECQDANGQDLRTMDCPSQGSYEALQDRLEFGL